MLTRRDEQNARIHRIISFNAIPSFGQPFERAIYRPKEKEMRLFCFLCLLIGIFNNIDIVGAFKFARSVGRSFIRWNCVIWQSNGNFGIYYFIVCIEIAIAQEAIGQCELAMRNRLPVVQLMTAAAVVVCVSLSLFSFVSLYMCWWIAF